MMTKALSTLKLDLRAILSTTPPPPDEVLQGLPVGAVGALVAPGGIGKTMLLLSICLALAAGRRCPLASQGTPKGPRKPAPVVLVLAEETVEEMHRRLHHVVDAEVRNAKGVATARERSELAGLLEENLRVYPLAGRGRLMFGGDDDEQAVKSLDESVGGARLVVLDPLRQFHAGDENDSASMTSLVQTLQSIASRHRCAVLISHHTSKSASMGGTGDQAGASRGSGALTDALRWQMNLSRLDVELGKRYAISPSQLGQYVRADLSKANYVAPQPALVFRREAGGVLKALPPVLNAPLARSR